MHVTKLSLKNFRNWSDSTIEFKEGINVLTGANAQGKTNCAEAIFLLCTGYSPRANKDKLFIKSGETQAEISAVAQSKYGTVDVKMVFTQDTKRIFINGIQVLKIGELLGNINGVFFNPQDLKLVQETPEDRRRFLNVSLSQMNKNYFYALSRYNKILAQRNNLLKDPDQSLVRETLPIWDMQLVKHASKIIVERNAFIKMLSPIAKEKHAYLSDGKETLSISTESTFSGSEEEVAYELLTALKKGLERDLRLGYTSIGPHRDDIKFTLNDIDVRVFGSQGQQRTVALSLKLAEAQTFYNKFGEYPVLILDDVLSELDKTRQRKLVSASEGIQTIFTSTVVDRTVFKSADYNRIDIVNGNVKKPKR